MSSPSSAAVRISRAGFEVFTAVIVDVAGDLYIADGGNQRVRGSEPEKASRPSRHRDRGLQRGLRSGRSRSTLLPAGAGGPARGTPYLAMTRCGVLTRS